MARPAVLRALLLPWSLHSQSFFASPQALEPQRFLQRRPLGSHLAARGYLSQALIFSVDPSWLVPYPQVFFRGHAKNQRLLKPSIYFSHKISCFLLELDHFSLSSVRVGWGRLWAPRGDLWGLVPMARTRWDDVISHWAEVQPVPISTGTLEVSQSCATPVMRMRHKRWHGKGLSFLPALNCNKGSLSYPSSHPAVPLLLSV